MSNCKIKKYIEDLPVSQKEKYRLDNLHNQIGEDAVKSGGFRRFENNIYTLKNKFNLASKFIGDKNKEFGKQIVKLVRTSNNNFLLESDVSSLAEFPTPISYENLLVLNPSTSISENDFNSLTEDEQEMLIFQAKNC